jgi:hypothetical protein
MQEHLGHALGQFNAVLDRLRAPLARVPALEAAVFAGTEDWRDLLLYKLLPHFEGEGCLVAAVAGGTNTGKSTVFNLLLGRDISPVRNTAAATSRPVLAGNQERYEQCLAGRLMPEFLPQPLAHPEAVVRSSSATETLFAVLAEDLPSRLVLLDTPDVDSIDRQNWEVADHIRAAGDVLIAILTGEKYKDERVVQFFQHARQAGRVILPVMNKANPGTDFQIAREQLAEFAQDVGLEDPVCFVVPHDFDIARDFSHAISGLDQDLPLREYLEQLDVAAIKTRVYRDTVQHFAERAGEFLANARVESQRLRQVVDHFEHLAQEKAQEYLPAPGAALGGLFHEYVQSKRGRMERAIGGLSRGFSRGIVRAGRIVGGTIRRRITLEPVPQDKTEEALHAHHRTRIEALSRSLLQQYIETARGLRPPADTLVLEALERIQVDRAVDQIARQAVRSDNLSDSFRDHAKRELDRWWNENPKQRMAMQALDVVLAGAPVAIAGVMTVSTGGFGVPEAVVAAGTLAEQFAAHVVQYQFGDQIFGLVALWQRDQQAALEQALREHLAAPALAPLQEILEPLEAHVLDELEHWREQCLNLISTS